MLICNVEICVVCYVFCFETQNANHYECGSDMFWFSILLIRICYARMRSSDEYAYLWWFG